MFKKRIYYLLIIIFLMAFLVSFHKRVYTSEDFDIVIYKSDIDKDNDGIDDQTDILNSVRDYVSKKPKYKSKYYAMGYPIDNYGVCTDVVLFGLLGAGYDLMELVNEDIKINKSLYNIDVIDKNIDFRRTSNLKVYFENKAITLTKDIGKIEDWQGGDIVLFKNHIGIISDKRNKFGEPYVIHHYSSWQRKYEEDVLRSWGEIIGHYRIS